MLFQTKWAGYNRPCNSVGSVSQCQFWSLLEEPLPESHPALGYPAVRSQGKETYKASCTQV